MAPSSFLAALAALAGAAWLLPVSAGAQPAPAPDAPPTQAQAPLPEEPPAEAQEEATEQAEAVEDAADAEAPVEDIEPDALPMELADAMIGRQCAAWDTDAPALEGSFRADLGDGIKLWAIVCDAAAYNVSYSLFLDRDEGAAYRPLLFADYNEAIGWTGTDRLFNISFDAGGRVLSAYYKGRGTGDCGTSATWTWNGSAFRLDRFRSKEECDGAAAGAEDFPVIYGRGG